MGLEGIVSKWPDSRYRMAARRMLKNPKRLRWGVRLRRIGGANGFMRPLAAASSRSPIQRRMAHLVKSTPAFYFFLPHLAAIKLQHVEPEG